MSGYLQRKLAGRRGRAHAVDPDTRVALCRRSGDWSTHEELAVTCRQCQRVIARKANQGARHFAAACRGEHT